MVVQGYASDAYQWFYFYRALYSLTSHSSRSLRTGKLTLVEAFAASTYAEDACACTLLLHVIYTN
jgi:hypothetical protein